MKTSPVGRLPTCGNTLAPRALAAFTWLSTPRHWFGSSFSNRVKVALRPLVSLRRQISSTSDSRLACSGASGWPLPRVPAGISWNTPAPARFIAAAIACSSASSANVPGTWSPWIERCPLMREVENPTAPALSASSTIAAMRPMSSSLAAALALPRAPIT